MIAPEFFIAGEHYRFDGMPALIETRIFRRFAPLIATALPLMMRKSRKPGVPLEVRPDADFVKFAQAIFDSYGTLSDDDSDMIQRACLGALSRQMAGEWHPVWVPQDDAPAFPDLTGALTMRLTLSALGAIVRRSLDSLGMEVPAEIHAAAAKLH